jgi:hypothetical protein
MDTKLTHAERMELAQKHFDEIARATEGYYIDIHVRTELLHDFDLSREDVIKIMGTGKWQD